MFRDGNYFSYKDRESEFRPKKISEIRRELETEIRRKRNWLNKIDRNNFTEEHIKTVEAKLAILERKLSLLGNSRTPQLKKSYKKLSLDKIKELVLKEIEIAKANGEYWLTLEDISQKLNIKKHFVKQVFQQLNVEGVLSQKYSRIPHDSNRDPMCNGFYSGWQSDIYYILLED